jgi:AAA+ ATPase superfamily predicted ATPase
VEKFVARENELGEIHAALAGDGSRHSIVLHGLGGIGKTQLAVEYARRHKDSYSAIFWLDIRDEGRALSQSPNVSCDTTLQLDTLVPLIWPVTWKI